MIRDKELELLKEISRHCQEQENILEKEIETQRQRQAAFRERRRLIDSLSEKLCLEDGARGGAR